MNSVILVGTGAKEPERFLEYGIPVVTTWQAADLIDNTHPNYFGRPGIWGARLPNMVLGKAEVIQQEGGRLCGWTLGWDFDRRRLGEARRDEAWLEQCQRWRKAYPAVEPGLHDDPEGGIHPWRFTDALQKYFAQDEIIVTDMGTALVAAHQVLQLKPPQRLMTSGGLGEMGVGIPAAIGASFARSKGRVICLHCDGGMMQNLQELQTIAHHRLPIKVIVYDNQAYGMIKQTQEIAGYRYSGSDLEGGMSIPDLVSVARGFGLLGAEVRTWDDFNRLVPKILDRTEPAVIVYRFPYVPLWPKVTPQSEGLWDTMPRL